MAAEPPTYAIRGASQILPTALENSQPRFGFRPGDNYFVLALAIEYIYGSRLTTTVR